MYIPSSLVSLIKMVPRLWPMGSNMKCGSSTPLTANVITALFSSLSVASPVTTSMIALVVASKSRLVGEKCMPCTVVDGTTEIPVCGYLSTSINI